MIKNIIKKFVNKINAETVTEALVTFFIAIASVLIVATSILTSRKIINASSERSNILQKDNEIIGTFIFGAEDKMFNNARLYTDKISISSKGYLYSENMVECIETNESRLLAFR